MDLMKNLYLEMLMKCICFIAILFENKAAQYLQSNFLLKYYGIVIVIATFHYDETFEIFVA